MKITFDQKVQVRLPKNKKLVLDFDHTLSRQNIDTDCCGITRYRIVAVDQVPEVFDYIIPSNAGPIYYKKWASFYLDADMAIRENPNQLIELQGSGGIIAKNIEIVNM